MAAGARIVLAGWLLIWGGVADFGVPPPALHCPLLDERGTPTPRGALLRLIWGGGAESSPETPQNPPREPQNPPREHQPAFDVSDPLGLLKGFWGPSWDPPKRCELSPTTPLLPSLGTPPKCHPGLGTRWWLLALGTPGREGTVLLQELGGDPPTLNASLLISTLTPKLQGFVGIPQTLHCSFAPWEGREDKAFSLEWLRHRDGLTRSLLAFDSATSRVTQASPGVLLLLGGQGGGDPQRQSSQPLGGALEVSLQLPPLSVSDGGSFICSVTTPRGQVQQVLHLDVIAPPQVSLSPSPLSPGLPAELRCHAVGFFPLDVGMRWELRSRGVTQEVTPGMSPRVSPGVAWSSGHRKGADGTFSRSSGLRVASARPGDSYSCVVTHAAWDTPRRVTVEVTGASGPSVEDVAGVALVAFVIGGLCVRLWPPAGR